MKIGLLYMNGKNLVTFPWATRFVVIKGGMSGCATLGTMVGSLLEEETKWSNRNNNFTIWRYDDEAHVDDWFFCDGFFSFERSGLEFDRRGHECG